MCPKIYFILAQFPVYSQIYSGTRFECLVIARVIQSESCGDGDSLLGENIIEYLTSFIEWSAE